MAFSSAVGRLAVLSQHLAADCDAQSTLQRQETRADEEGVRPAPGGGPGTLTVLDNRTGKKYTVRVFVHGRGRGLRTGGGLVDTLSTAAAVAGTAARFTQACKSLTVLSPDHHHYVCSWRYLRVAQSTHKPLRRSLLEVTVWACAPMTRGELRMLVDGLVVGPSVDFVAQLDTAIHACAQQAKQISSMMMMLCCR